MRIARLHAPELALVVIALISIAIYLRRLDTTPPQVSSDEAHFAVHAQALAATGRDDNGTTLPLFFHLTDPVRPSRRTEAWWQPMLFYEMAAALRIAPLSVATIRGVVASIAIVNIVLVYFVAKRWFGEAWYGTLASAMIALTPAHIMLGRQATDYFLPITFVLLWLYALPRCVESTRVRVHALTGLTLGIGLYSYVTSWIVMPVLLLVTQVVLARAGKKRAEQLALAAGFATALLPLGLWLLTHPTTMTNVSQRYWDFFSPTHLLLIESAPAFTGAFLLPVGALAAVGAYGGLRSSDESCLGRPLTRVALLSVICIPIAGASFSPAAAMDRALAIVPMAALLAANGTSWLWGSAAKRALCVLLLLASTAQFLWWYGAMHNRGAGMSVHGESVRPSEISPCESSTFTSFREVRM